MATNFPSGLDALTNPASSDTLNAPSHAGQHANANDAIEAIEAKVGVDGSADATSLDYKVNKGTAIVSSTAPSSPVTDQLWYDTTAELLKRWDGSAWVALGTYPSTMAQAGTLTRMLGNLSTRRWTSRTSAADNQWRSVAWSPELGLFCAVSDTGTGNRVMTSPDGITWTSRTSAADNGWTSVAWSPELGLFCAVSFNGTGNRVMTSRQLAEA